MLRRSAIVLAAALSLAALTACTTPAPVAPDPVPAPPSVDGTWTATRTLLETTVTPESLVVGAVEARSIELSDSVCDDAGVCTGLLTTALSADPADEASAYPGEFTWDGEELILTISTGIDCAFTDGTVASPDAFMVETVYDLTVSDGDDLTVTAFTGTVTATASTTEEAVGAGCEETGGERIYDVTMVTTATPEPSPTP